MPIVAGNPYGLDRSLRKASTVLAELLKLRLYVVNRFEEIMMDCLT